MMKNYAHNSRGFWPHILLAPLPPSHLAEPSHARTHAPTSGHTPGKQSHPTLSPRGERLSHAETLCPALSEYSVISIFHSHSLHSDWMHVSPSLPHALSRARLSRWGWLGGRTAKRRTWGAAGRGGAAGAAPTGSPGMKISTYSWVNLQEERTGLSREGGARGPPSLESRAPRGLQKKNPKRYRSLRNGHSKRTPRQANKAAP